MKTRKKLYLILTTALLIMPEITQAAEYIICGEQKKFPLAFAKVTSNFILIIKILVPIFLVIGGMIAFFKVTISSNVEEDLKKAKDKLINRIIAAVVIFFTLSIINFAVSLVAGKNNNLMSCINCFMNPDKCETTEIKDEINSGFVNDPKKVDADGNNTYNATNNNNTTNNSTNTNSNSNNSTTSSSFDNVIFLSDTGNKRYNNAFNTEILKLGENVIHRAINEKELSELQLAKDTYSDFSAIMFVQGVENMASKEKIKTLITKTHESSPDVPIYIYSVYHIASSYAGDENNNNIDAFNLSMKEFADANDWCHYIDITKGLYDEYGYLKSEYTYNGLFVNEEGLKVLIDNIKSETK